MIGTIANTSTILIGSIVGSTLKKGIGEILGKKKNPKKEKIPIFVILGYFLS